MSLKEVVTAKLGMAAGKVKAASPEILLVGGIISMGAAVVTGILAARKHDSIIDEHNERLEIAKVTHIVVSDEDDVNVHEEEIRVLTEKEVARKVRYEYCRTAAKMVKLYAPTALCMALSTWCFLKMHNIQGSRLTRAYTAYMGLKEASERYENRNIELNGEESHRLCKYGWHEEEIEDPETGEIKKIKVANEAEDLINEAKSKIKESDVDPTHLPWRELPIFVFSKSTSSCYYGNKSMDLSTLNAAQSNLNALLPTREFISVNDVLDALGMQRIPEGQWLGWVDGCGGPIVLGHEDPINNRWLAGYQTNEIVLDLNNSIHGNILWLLAQKKVINKEDLLDVTSLNKLEERKGTKK